VPPRRKRNGAAPGQVSAAQVEQASDQHTEATPGRVANLRYAVEVLGGYPRQIRQVFAVCRHAVAAEEVAASLRKRRCNAHARPAKPQDFPGRILDGGDE